MDFTMDIWKEPSVGLGTLGLRESAGAAVGAAVEFGSDLIDTGEHYGNLELVGVALNKSVRKPSIVVKLSGMPTGDYAAVRARMICMLEALGIESAALCLMHWPGACTWDPADMAPLASPGDFQGKASSWDEFQKDVVPAWKNMLNLQKEGLCGEVGTSNFYAHHLTVLAETCNGAVPFANQIFIDITNPETDFVNSMQRSGIHVLAYRPVAYKPYPDCIKAMAERLGESAQSIILGWFLRRGIYPFVKCRGDHVKENLTVPAHLKDKITAEDMAEIESCEADMRFSAEWFAKIWRSHNATSTFTEEDVHILTAMGVDEAKARVALKKCGGDMDAAMDMAFS